MEDVICAVATSLGIGAISIVRVSGQDSIKIVNKFFKGKNLLKVPSHTLNYGYIKYNHEIIDEVLVSVMHAPKTFTRENVVEINCHGGILSANKILERLITEGCRLARPGEFTKRAYLNGRIDLIEAESIIDLISAKTDQVREMALKGIKGEVSNKIKTTKNRILNILANIEVNIDYPEYDDVLEMTNQLLSQEIKSFKIDLEKMILESEKNKLLKEGIKVGIVGKPNVGKSSILNKILLEEKAIVTDIAGTTRDLVEGVINLDGLLLTLVDTAGIRKTIDKIEQEGINKSKQIIENSDLILLVLNNNEKFSKEDQELLDITANKKRIVIVNKQDLRTELDLDNLKNIEYIKINSLTGEGLEYLKEKIKEKFSLDQKNDFDYTYISSVRIISSLKQIYSLVKEIERNLIKGIPLDLIAIDLKKIIEKLGEIIGEGSFNDLTNEIFSSFCLGK